MSKSLDRKSPSKNLKDADHISMSISEVLLFVASNSRMCRPCIEFIHHHKFPAQIVRLDSEEARSAAASGEFFQITVVPTMVVNYEDGNTQLFVGAPKIVQWMTQLINRSKPRPEDERERGVTSYLPAGGNMYGPRPNPPRELYQPEPLMERRSRAEEYPEPKLRRIFV